MAFGDSLYDDVRDERDRDARRIATKITPQESESQKQFPEARSSELVDPGCVIQLTE